MTGIGDGKLANTGFKNPSANTGEFTNPTDAYTSNDIRATGDVDQVHQYYQFGFLTDGIPENVIITGIIVRLEGYSELGNQNIKVDLSWDNGSSWTSPQKDSGPFQSSTDETIDLGSSTDKWNHSWTRAELADDKFRVRLTIGSFQEFLELDWIAVNIYYLPSLTLEELLTIAPRPLVGLTDSSGTNWSIWNYPAKVATKYQFSKKSNVKKLVVYIASSPAGCNIRGIIYNDDNGSPNNLVKVTPAISGAIGWNDLDFAENALLDPGNYWLGIVVVGGTPGNCYKIIRYSSGTTNQTAYNASGVTDPFGSPTYYDRKISIYAVSLEGEDLLLKKLEIVKKETILLSEAIQTLLLLFKTLFETFFLTDKYTKIWNGFRQFTEMFSVIEILRKKPKLIKEEILTTVDFFSRIVSYFRTYSETLQLLDQIKKFFKTIQIETLSLTDILLKTSKILKTEAFSLIDSISSILSKIKELFESLSLISQVSLLSSFFRSFLEILTSTDILKKKIMISKSEILTLIDLVSKIASYIRNIIESLLLVDQFSRVNSFFRTYYETFTLSDSVETLITLIQTIFETLNLIDQFSTIGSFFRSNLESLILTEKVTKILTILRIENILLVEVIKKRFKILRYETLNLIDNFSKILKKMLTLFETLTFTIILRKRLSVIKTEIFSLLDQVSSIKAFFRTLSETLNLVGTLSTQALFYLLLKGILTMAEAKIRKLGKVLKERTYDWLVDQEG